MCRSTTTIMRGSFDDLGGVNGMEILTAETDPDLVKFNIDVYWVWYGKADPADFIAEHADRAGYYHFKDGKRRTDENGNIRPHFLELGRGEVDLKAAYAAALAADAKSGLPTNRTALPLRLWKAPRLAGSLFGMSSGYKWVFGAEGIPRHVAPCITSSLKRPNRRRFSILRCSKSVRWRTDRRARFPESTSAC